MVVHAFSPSTCETKAGQFLGVWIQPDLQIYRSTTKETGLFYITYEFHLLQFFSTFFKKLVIRLHFGFKIEIVTYIWLLNKAWSGREKPLYLSLHFCSWNLCPQAGLAWGIACFVTEYGTKADARWAPCRGSESSQSWSQHAGWGAGVAGKTWPMSDRVSPPEVL